MPGFAKIRLGGCPPRPARLLGPRNRRCAVPFVKPVPGLMPAVCLCLINPSNPLVSIVNVKESRWNRYRLWKPLSLMVVAGLTPREWDISIVDENLGVADHSAMPRPDLVGITAFTEQANRAYEVAPLTSVVWAFPSSWAVFTQPCV